MNKIILDNRVLHYQVFFKKNKNLYMRVRNNLITITCPKKFSISEIETFIIKHQEQILKRIEIKKVSLYNPEELVLWGNKISIADIVETLDKTMKKKFIINENMIEFFYKTETIKYAKKLLDEEFSMLNHEFNLSCITLKSQLMRSRLGSCNVKTKRINLNSVLARLDKKYLRAVLLHEIIHLKEANHQRDFYDLLLKYEPKYREIKKELNQIMKKYEI